MTERERAMLTDFLNQLIRIRGVQKDPEAEALIRRALQQQPDAAYLLVQKALLQEEALDNAKTRIRELEQYLQQSPPAHRSSGGLLGALFGHRRHASGHGVLHRSYRRSTGYPQAHYGPYSGTGSFLGTAAATAAGMVGGAFLFNGIENLMGMDEGDTMNDFYGDSGGLGDSGFGDVGNIGGDFGGDGGDFI